jgi:hypothetical protein
MATEAGYPFSALGDLLESSLDEVGDELPAPQIAGLETAFLRRDAAGPPADPRVVSAGVFGVLRALGSKIPVMVAIDDVQRLDRESAVTLAYAFRRLAEPACG